MSAYDHIGEAGSLVVNDYIYSPSRLCFAVLEANGQFNVYAGESPDDPAKIKVWSTGVAVSPDRVVSELVLRSGPFDHSSKNLQIFTDIPGQSRMALLWACKGSGDLQSPMEGRLGDDGSLSLRQNQQGIWNEIWNSGFSDPVVEYTVETIDYDKPRALIKANTPTQILQQNSGKWWRHRRTDAHVEKDDHAGYVELVQFGRIQDHNWWIGNGRRSGCLIRYSQLERRILK